MRQVISMMERAMELAGKHRLVSGVLLSVVALILSVDGEQTPCDFPAIYNFGDSNSDTGGISAAFAAIPSPYGDNFFRKPAGRTSDGRLIIDFIADHLGLPYTSPYLDSVGTNFRHGANFATGGSTILRPRETIFESGISPFNLDVQTIQFNQFKARTSDLYNDAKNSSARDELPRPKDFSKALYTLDIGQNDLAAGFRNLNHSQVRALIPIMVDQFAAAVQRLYQQGGRTFWIHNTGPIGCLPIATFNLQSPEPGFLDEHGCVVHLNDMAAEFNKQLKATVIKLRPELSHAALTYVDVYTAKYRLIGDTKNLGFGSPQRICCGHHETEKNIHVWCGERGIVNGSEVYGSSCSNPTAHISWDGINYSQAANHWVANHILNGSLSDHPFPFPKLVISMLPSCNNNNI